MTRILSFVLSAVAVAGLAAPALAARPISIEDSFRIGTTGVAVCTGQTMPPGPALADMFDRGYAIACRDAAVSVGQLFALRTRAGDPAARLASLRAPRATCTAPREDRIEGLGAVELSECRLTEADVAYRVYMVRRGNVLFAAEGLAGYDSALRLGLRTLVEDRPVPGEVTVATTGIGDPAAFARVQAGSLSPERALAEAYRRNNSGNYAEAAEFFATLATGANSATRVEAMINEALQKSNLGYHVEANGLFAQAEPLVRGDPVIARQYRNFRTMHLLNQGRVDEAESELARPLPTVDPAAGQAVRELRIDAVTAAQLSAETPGARRLGGSEGLTPRDRIQILDAQALQLRGSIQRLRGRNGDAVAALQDAERQLMVVRDGRVAATQFLRAQILSDLADLAEERGDLAAAERHQQDAVALVETHYPGSAALLAAQGRLAAFHARNGRRDQALGAYRRILASSEENGLGTPAPRRLLQPYFDLLIGDGSAAGPDAVAEAFRASHLLVRPGVAQTQAVLARELSGGSDEAARLFRQSVSLARDSERLRVEIARLRERDGGSPRLRDLRSELERVQAQQVATQAELARFPRYRAVANGSIDLAALQAQLRPGEAYYRMMVLDDRSYGLFVTTSAARAFPVGATPQELEWQVDAVRASISTVEGGEIVTLPFDIETAHVLYRALFDPVASELAETRHLIFEPDGAMLRLPPNLLVMDRRSVDSYRARAARPGDDGFDFRGTAWLGRDRDVSTSVSPRAFADLRQSAPSRAPAHYIGFGQHKPADAFFLPATGLTRGSGADGCSWSLAAWGRPISAAELVAARQQLGGSGAEVVTGSAFTDEAIKARGDLDRYRIVHFATHGLLQPARQGCPARPSLMTSFGGSGSDGLLSFGEIFDLRLDADVVILSACDTAGRSSLAANREAGISGGGDHALDGLVRAFVGAGGRLVVASHWPVPDDFDATQRLISGMFRAPPGTGTAAALRAAQHALMDDVMTSHPFYWSGFAVVGDGSLPLLHPAPAQTAAAQ